MEPQDCEEEVVQIYDAGDLKFYERRAASSTEEPVTSPRIRKGKSVLFDSFSSLLSGGSSSPNPSPQASRKSYFPRLSIVSKREEEPIFPISVTRRQLCEIINNPKTCNRLVSLLLKEQKNAYSNKVSFLAAMEQYEQSKTYAEKKNQASNIVTMFIESGSMFELEQIAQGFRSELLIGKNHPKLMKLKDIILDILLRDETVAGFIMETADSDSEGSID
jgi:hypothetical protein